MEFNKFVVPLIIFLYVTYIRIIKKLMLKYTNKSRINNLLQKRICKLLTTFIYSETINNKLTNGILKYYKAIILIISITVKCNDIFKTKLYVLQMKMEIENYCNDHNYNKSLLKYVSRHRFRNCLL